MSDDRHNLSRRPSRVAYAGAVTVRRGGSRTIDGRFYQAGQHYAPDDPGVLAAPQFFVLAKNGSPQSPAPTRKVQPDPELEGDLGWTD